MYNIVDSMWFKKVNNTMRIVRTNLTDYKHRDEVAYNILCISYHCVK